MSDSELDALRKEDEPNLTAKEWHGILARLDTADANTRSALKAWRKAEAERDALKATLTKQQDWIENYSHASTAVAAGCRRFKENNHVPDAGKKV